MICNDSERALLGAALVEHGLARRLVNELRESDFTSERHRAAFSVIGRTVERHDATDVDLVAHEAGEAEAEQVSRDFLLELLDVVATVGCSTFDRHAEIVHEAATRRRAAALLDAQLRALTDDGAPTGQVLEELRAGLEELDRHARCDDIFKEQWIDDPALRADRPPALVEDLIFPGLTTVSGLWKVGKTWAMLYLTMLLAAGGGSFCGRRVRGASPGWIQLDQGEASFAEYWDLLVAGGRAATRFPFLADKRIDLANPEHRSRIAAWVERAELDVVVIDSARACSTIEENSSEQVMPITRGFLCGTLRDRLGCDVILIAHAARHSRSGVRGSGEFEAAADSNIFFSRGDDEIITVTGRGRHLPTELKIRIDDLRDHGGGVRISQANSSNAALVRQWLARHPGLHSMNEIAEALGKNRSRDVKPALEELERDGLASQASGGWRVEEAS